MTREQLAALLALRSGAWPWPKLDAAVTETWWQAFQNDPDPEGLHDAMRWAIQNETEIVSIARLRAIRRTRNDPARQTYRALPPAPRTDTDREYAAEQIAKAREFIAAAKAKASTKRGVA